MKLSVIIPMYNAAAWIERCLMSVVAQTTDSWECIVVDNASTDQSLSVARQVAHQSGCEERFVFLSLATNYGPGPARNRGIETAQGDYLAFLDADDWLDADIYQKLLSCTADNPDIVLGNTRLKSNASRQQLLRAYPPSSCFHLYRRDFILRTAIRFPSERTSEDSYFVAACVLTADSWQTTDAFGYHIFQNPQSVSRRRNTTRYIEKLSVFARLIDFAQQHGVLMDNKAELRRIYLRKATMFSLIEYIRNNRPVKLKRIRDIFSITRKQLRRLR